MEKKFVANKAVLVNAQGKILLVRDAGKLDHNTIEGKWDFPGGRMDVGETPHEGLLRELKEEIGLGPEDVVIESPINVGLWGVGGDKLNQPIIGIFYIVRLIGSPEIKLSDEHTEFQWVDPRNTPPNCDPLPGGETFELFRKHEGIVVASDESIKGRQGYGLIQLFTGNGKGKTTASLGETIRAVGAGKRVGIVFFDKGGDSHYFERKVLDGLEGVEYVATGRDRIDPITNKFDFSITDTDKTEGTRGLQEVSRMFMENYDVIVMDEVNSSADLGIISVKDVLKLLDTKPDTTELIMTGRNAPKEFIDRAHLMTQMKLRKHYFYSGVKAREGLDF